jgi:hypothetical protein
VADSKLMARVQYQVGALQYALCHTMFIMDAVQWIPEMPSIRRKYM